MRLFELLSYYSWILDRFHLSTKLYQKVVHGREYDIGWLEERLKALGFRLVFCTRKRESFERVRAERVKVSEKPSQYDDLQIFIREPETMGALVEESRPTKMELDISDNEVGRAVETIADWLESNGRLYAR